MATLRFSPLLLFLVITVSVLASGCVPARGIASIYNDPVLGPKVAAASRAYNQKRYEEAIALYDELIALGLDIPEVFSIRAIANLESGRYEEAIDAYSEIIARRPNDAFAFSKRGDAKYYMGRYEEAIVDYYHVIEMEPDLAAVTFYDLGLAKMKLGRYEEAIDDYDQSIALGYKCSCGFYRRGFAKMKLGRYEEAVADYDKAIELSPKSPPHAFSSYTVNSWRDDKVRLAHAFNGRGFVKIKLGRYKAAIADYDKAIKIKPDYPEAIEGREVARQKLAQDRGG